MNKKVKLLILTQKVDKDDDNLGFFHTWLLEFAKSVEQLTVICLQKGNNNLPENVKVLSLGKEEGVSRLKYVINFYKYIFQERKNYDIVFTHMNPEYVVLGGLLWRFWKKTITLWYVHKSVDLKLVIAEKFVHKIFTATKSSFRLKSEKLSIVGHGIPIEKFVCKKNKQSDLFEIVHIGRITKIKNISTLIEAVKILKERIANMRVVLVGTAITEKDKKYKQMLEEKVKEYALSKIVFFAGSVPNKEIPALYCQADVSVNLSPDGGMDKSVLESAASGVPVISTNNTFEDFFGDNSQQLLCSYNNAEELAEKIEQIQKLPSDKLEEIKSFLRERSKKYDVKKLIKKIVFILDELQRSLSVKKS